MLPITHPTLRPPKQKGRPVTAFLFGVFGLMFAAFGPAHAQEVDLNVTYEDVLNNPDDIEINILYARTQIRNGRLDRAVAALERVLLKAPELHNVRLLYAIVLFRLDNMEESKAAFQALKRDAGLNVDEDREVDAYLEEIDNKRKRINHTVSVSMGTHYDTNRNGATTSGTLLVLDTEYDSTDGEKHDFGHLATINAETRFDPGFNRAHQIYISTSGLIDEQATIDAYDTISASLTAGGKFLTDSGSFDVSLSHSRTSLQRTSYLYTHGLNVSYERTLNKDTTLTLSEAMTHQAYRNYGDNTDNTTDNGNLFNTSATLNLRIDPTLYLTITPSHQKKNGKESQVSYRNLGLVTTLTQTFDQGQFLSGYLGYNHYTYRMADSFVSTTVHREWRYRARLSAGMPIKTLFDVDWLPEALGQSLLTASIERYKATANIINYTTSNWRGQIMLSKPFRF